MDERFLGVRRLRVRLAARPRLRRARPAGGGLSRCGSSRPPLARSRRRRPEGLWLHRYWTTGEPAPSWGLHQVDETGAALLAIEAAFGELEDEELDLALWPAVRQGRRLPPLLPRSRHRPAAGEHGSLGAARRSARVLGRGSRGRPPGRSSSVRAPRAGSRARSTPRPRSASPRRSTTRSGTSRPGGISARWRWPGATGSERRPGRPSSAGSRTRTAASGASTRSTPRLDSSLLGLAWPFAPPGPSRARVQRDRRRRRAWARRTRRRPPPARGRRLRRWARVAAPDALARPRAAAPRRRRGTPASPRTCGRAGHGARPPPRAGAARRHAGLGAPARVEPRDAAARRAARAHAAAGVNCRCPTEVGHQAADSRSQTETVPATAEGVDRRRSLPA